MISKFIIFKYRIGSHGDFQGNPTQAILSQIIDTCQHQETCYLQARE